MTEPICNQGHVIDPGLLNCSRCGGSAIGTAEVAPVINEETVTGTENVDIKSLTVKELKEKLAELDVDFKSSDSKAVLQKKLKKALK